MLPAAERRTSRTSPRGSGSRLDPEVAAIPPRLRPSARRLGLDVYRIESDAGAAQRKDAIGWVLGLDTRTGNSRAERVRKCGQLHVARCGDIYGLDHSWCRDRACPVCMRHKQRKEAAQVRQFFEHREDAGGRFLFATLTQPKKHHDDEAAGDALDRLFRSFRRLTNTKYATGREFRHYFAGGIRAAENVYSGRLRVDRETKQWVPNVSKDGTPILFDGWHAHIHAVLELNPPPPSWVDKYGEDRAWERWSAYASARLEGLWLEVSEGARGSSQKIMECDVNRVAQITKYLTKPFELKDRPWEARELFRAMKGRRIIEGIGEWRQWRKLELPEDPRPPVELAGETFEDLLTCAENGGSVHFRIEYATAENKSFSIGEPVPATLILAAIREDPRTFTQRREAERKRLIKERAFLEECESMHRAADRFEDELNELTVDQLKARLKRITEVTDRRFGIDRDLLSLEASP